MTAVKGPGERGKLYEFAAGTMPSIATDHLGGQLYRSAIVEQIQLYKDCTMPCIFGAPGELRASRVTFRRMFSRYSRP